MPKNLWTTSQEQTQSQKGKIESASSDLDQLIYRSRLLASDRSVIHPFGGDTSAKSTEIDHMGRSVSVLWVKGGESDLAQSTAADFVGLRLEELLPLMERERLNDEALSAYLGRCVFEPGRPLQSIPIETLLHAFIPYAHVDHTHPDAIVALACTARGAALARDLYGDSVIWMDYQRPGFALAKQIGQAVRANPQARAVVMTKHGLLTWGEDSKSCYDQTIAVIQKAEEALDAVDKRTFTGVDMPALPTDQRANLAAELMPLIRGSVMARNKQIILFDDSDTVLKFIGTAGAKTLAMVGAASPEHVAYTKRVPLFVESKRNGEGDLNVDQLKTALREGLSRYQSSYTEYFAANHSQNKEAGLKMADPSPRIVLVQGVGMFAVGRDAGTADIVRQMYHRAIAVMELAERIDKYAALSEQESFEVEYGPFERQRLSLRSPERDLSGRVALVTGAANGIGRAIAQRLAEAGAHIVITDIAMDGAKSTAEEIVKTHGYQRAIAVKCNVTREDEVINAFKTAVRAYGGVDIVVNNAGMFLGNTIEQTSMDEWQRLSDVLGTGYFLIARQAFRVLRAQARGGSIIFIGSKNSVFAGKNVSAYSAAKAAELHMARCLAEEGGAGGIRVNTILPDAVVRGSGIWDQGAREQRAHNYGIKPEELEDYYRARTTLKVSIYPEDVAEAALFFASDKSLKTTGAILTVDGGVAGAYSR